MVIKAPILSWDDPPSSSQETSHRGARVGWFRIWGYFIQNIGGTLPETNSEFTIARLRRGPKRKRESLPTIRFFRGELC